MVTYHQESQQDIEQVYEAKYRGLNVYQKQTPNSIVEREDSSDYQVLGGIHKSKTLTIIDLPARSNKRLKSAVINQKKQKLRSNMSKLIALQGVQSGSSTLKEVGPGGVNGEAKPGNKDLYSSTPIMIININSQQTISNRNKTPKSRNEESPVSPKSKKKRLRYQSASFKTDPHCGLKLNKNKSSVHSKHSNGRQSKTSKSNSRTKTKSQLSKSILRPVLKVKYSEEEGDELSEEQKENQSVSFNQTSLKR